MQPETPPPPPGYRHHGRLLGSDGRAARWPLWLRFLWYNLVALLPMGALVLLLWLPYQLYLLRGAPWALLADPDWSTAVSIAVGAALLLTSIVVHELLHAAALLLLGYRPVITLQRGYMAASIQPGQFLTRRAYLLMSVTPFGVMTLVGGGLLLLLPPAAGNLLLITLLLNAAASIGDLLVAYHVFKTPSSALFTDGRGIQVYLPAPAMTNRPEP